LPLGVWKKTRKFPRFQRFQLLKEEVPLLSIRIRDSRKNQFFAIRKKGIGLLKTGRLAKEMALSRLRPLEREEGSGMLPKKERKLE
jgi:hypothetical protein